MRPSATPPGRRSTPRPDRASKRWATWSSARCALRLGLEEHGAERRQRQSQRVAPPVERDGHRLDPAEVPLTAAAVLGGVAVEDLPPEAGLRRAHAIVLPDDRREVEHSQHALAPRAPLSLAFIPAEAQQRDHAVLAVVGVDPLEAGGVVVELVQRGLALVEAVEVPHQALDPGVALVLEEMPVEAAVVPPLLPLPQLAAHEEELLARLRVLVAEQQPQAGPLLPLVAGHLAEERALAMHHLVVRERQGELLAERVEPPEGELVVMEAAVDGVEGEVGERVVHPPEVPLVAEA